MIHGQSACRSGFFATAAAASVTHLVVLAVLAARLDVVLLLGVRSSHSRLEAVVVVQRPRAGVPGS
jgi:hypothetical protein